MRIVLTGGGTGGHLMPFEPIIEALRVQHLEQKAVLPARIDAAEFKLYFLGIADRATKDFFATYDVDATHIPSGKLRRYASALTPLDMIFRLPYGIIVALVHMFFLMPDVVVSKGGYGSIPVLLAALFYRIPVLVHESDAVSGLSNRFIARFAAAICVGFAETKEALPQYHFKTFVTGTPVRSRFGKVSQAEAKQSFGFAAADTVVLVMGGSQGAASINEVVLQALPQLVLSTSIIHLTGPSHYTKISAVAGELLAASSGKDRYKPYPYLPETVIEAMTAADIIISRAGATTLSEIARLHKPCLLIPLDSAANDHQRRNAQALEHHGAAVVLDPTNLGKNLFERSVEKLLTDTTLRQKLSENIAKFDHPSAAREIATLTFKLAQELVPVAQQ